MDKELLAEYGKAVIDFEIAQARLNEVKKRVVEAHNKSVTTVTPEEKQP